MATPGEFILNTQKINTEQKDKRKNTLRPVSFNEFLIEILNASGLLPGLALEKEGWHDLHQHSKPGRIVLPHAASLVIHLLRENFY